MQTRLKAAVVLTMVLAAALGSYATHQFVRTPAKTAEAATLEVGAGADQPPLDRTPEVYQGDYRYTSVAGMLTALHITVYPEDKVYAFPDPILGLGSTLKVYRAQLVVIMDGTSSQTVRTWVSTVGALIDEQQLAIGAKDEVSPSADTVLPTDGRTFTLAITRVAETDVTTFQDIAYDTQSQNDPDLLQGVQQVQQQGVPGQKKLVYHVRRENGVQVSKVLTSSDIVKQPVSKIVLVGTKPKVVYLTSGQYASYFNEAVDKYGVSADSLNKVMKCESGGNVNDVSANGRYFGLFQFDKQTWSTTDYGSRSIFDPEAQILAAASLWQWHLSKWPTCSRGL